MNKIKKLLIKSEFLKAIEEYPTKWENTSLYYFEGSIHKLNKKIEDEFACCLSKVVDADVNIIPGFSNDHSIDFTINGLRIMVYELVDGKIKPVWNVHDRAFINRVNDLGSKLELINEAYIELMKNYPIVEIPLTERVSFAYSFYSGHWFQLKDKRDQDKFIEIRESFPNDVYVDTDKKCFFPWDDLEVLVKNIRIDHDYDDNLKKLYEDVTLRMEELKKDLGITQNNQAESHTHVYIPGDDEEETSINRLIIRDDNLFEYVNGVICVREEWKRHLRYLDLANISFVGVNIAGLDFTGSNAVIDPELVYNKDVSMCKFDKNNLVSDAYCGDDCVINQLDTSIECGKTRKR